MRRAPIGSAVRFLEKNALLPQLDMELTERCNYRCIHCYINLPHNDSNAQKRELPLKLIKDILEEAASLGCLDLRFTGGEPLLREDFEEIYVYARKLGFRVLLFTNASLITSRLARLFSQIPPLKEIEVTIYGLTRHSYEAVTCTPGSFSAFQRGLELLDKNNIQFGLKTTLLPSNRCEIEAVMAGTANFIGLEEPIAYSMFFNLRGRRNSEEKNRLIRKLRIAPEEALKILSRNKVEYLRDMQDFCKEFSHPSGKHLFSCGSGLKSGCMDAYGNFQMCMLLRDPKTVYNIKRGSLKYALTKFFPKIRTMEASNPAYLKRCARCFLHGLCEQCPAKSWMEHGTLDTPVEYLCEVAHAQARYLGLIEKGEKAWEITDWKKRIARFAREGLTNEGNL